MDGQTTVLSVVGPLSPSAASLRLVIRSLLSQDPWLHDPFVHEIPWRDEQEKAVLDIIEESKKGAGQLVFGILDHDKVVTPHPPVKRAMDIVAKTIQRLGHKVGLAVGIRLDER